MSWSPVDTVTLRNGQYATHIDGEESSSLFFYLGDRCSFRKSSLV